MENTVEIEGVTYPIPHEVLELIGLTSIERDKYRDRAERLEQYDSLKEPKAKATILVRPCYEDGKIVSNRWIGELYVNRERVYQTQDQDREGAAYVSVCKHIQWSINKGSNILLVDNEMVITKETKTFTEREIEQLQSKVHKITGNGEVMGLFNELLGNAAG